MKRYAELTPEELEDIEKQKGKVYTMHGVGVPGVGNFEFEQEETVDSPESVVEEQPKEKTDKDKFYEQWEKSQLSSEEQKMREAITNGILGKTKDTKSKPLDPVTVVKFFENKINKLEEIYDDVAMLSSNMKGNGLVVFSSKLDYMNRDIQKIRKNINPKSIKRNIGMWSAGNKIGKFAGALGSLLIGTLAISRLSAEDLKNIYKKVSDKDDFFTTVSSVFKIIQDAKNRTIEGQEPKQEDKNACVYESLVKIANDLELINCFDEAKEIDDMIKEAGLFGGNTYYGSPFSPISQINRGLIRLKPETATGYIKSIRTIKNNLNDLINLSMYGDLFQQMGNPAVASSLKNVANDIERIKPKVNNLYNEIRNYMLKQIKR